MRYLKLYESFEDMHMRVFVRNCIDSVCKKYGIKYYTINDDGSIDVDDGIGVFLRGKGLNRLPLNFRNIKRDFYSQDNDITSMYGFPISVGGDFSCANNSLTSLKGGPQSVGGYFNCSDNKVRTFEGFPRSLGGDLYCINNPVWLLWVLFEDKDKIELFNDFGITDGEVVIIDRLNGFLEMIGKPLIDEKSSLHGHWEELEKEGYKII